MSVKITIKNYRAYRDSDPVVFTIGPGITAVVGPNNCGKSSLLKFFLEFGNLFRRIAAGNNVVSLLNGDSVDSPTHHILDPLEVFFDGNTRDLSVEIEPIIYSGVSGSGRFRFSLSRANPQQWSCKAEGISQPESIRATPAGVRDVNGLEIRGLAQLVEFSKQIGNSIYVGPFRNAINEGPATYYDLKIGHAFADNWRTWKIGQTKQQSTLIYSVTQDIARIFGIERLEIDAATDGLLQLMIDGRPYKLREVGSGLAQFIYVLGNAAIHSPDYIFIDEPELNLHPSLQRDFLLSLASYAKTGVVAASHSIGLVRSTADRVFSASRQANGSIAIKDLMGTPNYSQFLGEMSFSSYQALGFSKVLLVEGVTEVKTIQQWLRLFKKDHEVVLLPLGGNNLINGVVEYALTELKRLTPNLSALIDSERKVAGGSPKPSHADFFALCQKVGIPIHMTNKRATENYFPLRAVQAEKGPKFSALGDYDELNTLAPTWGKNENWRIAGRMTLAEVEATDVGAFLKAL